MQTAISNMSHTPNKGYNISNRQYNNTQSIHQREQYIDTLATPRRNNIRNASPSKNSQIIQLQSKLNQLRASRLKQDSLHRQDQIKMEQEVINVRHGLERANERLDATEDENKKLRLILRDLAQKQTSNRQNNPFTKRNSNKTNFPLKKDMFTKIEEDDEEEDDDNNENNDTNENDENDTSLDESLNLSIGALAHFHGLQDFDVANPPSLLDTSQAIDTLRTPARIVAISKQKQNNDIMEYPTERIKQDNNNTNTNNTNNTNNAYNTTPTLPIPTTLPATIVVAPPSTPMMTNMYNQLSDQIPPTTEGSKYNSNNNRTPMFHTPQSGTRSFGNTNTNSTTKKSGGLFGGVMATPGLSPIGGMGGISAIKATPNQIQHDAHHDEHENENDISFPDQNFHQDINMVDEDIDRIRRDELSESVAGSHAARNLSLVLEEEANRSGLSNDLSINDEIGNEETNNNNSQVGGLHIDGGDESNDNHQDLTIDDLSGNDLSGTNLSGNNMSENNLSGNNMSETHLQNESGVSIQSGKRDRFLTSRPYRIMSAVEFQSISRDRSVAGLSEMGGSKL